MTRSSHSRLAEMQRKVEQCEETTRILLAADDAQSARIARMLHDNLGQYMAALQLGFRGLERDLDSGGNAKLTLQSLQAIAQSVGEELHKVALELRPTSLDDHGLVRSLTTFLPEWSLITKTAVSFHHVAMGESGLSRSMETNMFRLVRDMLRVVSQQGQVSKVSVILQRKSHCVVAVVEHDGKGPDNDHPSAECLATVKARVALMEGTLTIEDCAISGRTMIARVPEKA